MNPENQPTEPQKIKRKENPKSGPKIVESESSDPGRITLVDNIKKPDPSGADGAAITIINQQQKTIQELEEKLHIQMAQNDILKKEFKEAKDNTRHSINSNSAIEDMKKRYQDLEGKYNNLQKIADALKADKEKMILQEKEVTKELTKFLQVKSAKSHPFDKVISEQNMSFSAIKEALATLQEVELKGTNYKQLTDSDQSEFYDTIINVNSFLKLTRGKGWEIIRKKDSKTSLTGTKACVISVVGNYNKGKSWITSYLSNRKLPFGDNVHTKGISCIYPDDETPILYLDSVGFEEALRLQKLEKYLTDNQKTSETDTDKQQKVNTSIKSDKKLNLLKDKQYTEFFIQQFLLDTAKVIIIVVNQLTFADQKLINRIFAEFRGKKRIFVLHNFSTLYTKNDVEKYIKKDIIQSFDVEEIRYPQNLGPDLNHKYFREKDKEELCHVVFARDGSEAGAYYNESSKQILISTICAQAQQYHYLLEDALSVYLKDQFNRYIDNKSNLSDLAIKIEKAENIINVTPENPENKKPKDKEYLKLISNSAKPIEFKPCNFDDFGYMKVHFSSSTAQELPYLFFATKDAYILQVEMPGFSKEDMKSFKYRKITEDDGFYLVIEASKKIKQQEQMLMQPTIHFGEVICRTEKVKFAQYQDFGDKNTKEIGDGILAVCWERKIVDTGEF